MADSLRWHPRFLVLLALLAFLAGCASKRQLSFRPRSVELNSPRIELPMHPAADGLPLVSVDEGGVTRRYLLDTGAEGTLVTPKLAQQQGWPVREKDVMLLDAADNQHKSTVVRIARVSLGGAALSDFDAYTSDLEAIVSPADGSEELVLSLAMFADVLLTIDYPNNRLIIEQGELPPPDGKDILPLQLAAGNRVLLPLQVGKSQIWTRLDTGCAPGLIVPEWCAAAVPGGKRSISGPTLRMYYGKSVSRVARLAGDLEIGRHVFKRPPFVLAPGPDPTLGGGYLCHFAITIDQKNKRIRFSRSDPSPIPAPILRDPGFQIDPATGVVVGVTYGSDAERVGLRVGDKLLTINAAPYESLRNQRSRLISLFAGPLLHVQFQRDGQTYGRLIKTMEMLP